MSHGNSRAKLLTRNCSANKITKGINSFTVDAPLEDREHKVIAYVGGQ